ncbi:DUF1707 domain-containing protein [Nocardia ninae]|uniref:DUF1707 domain-containing protein n=1 Tax=Nocardia ninae NBRC 108245 TaxID=1210091 RepID=A0A511MGZ8_9NOCA|nr:DUF1707 domain-containing protein [Nocardia ninae]GEM39348.1 hypothetical protein NN4_38670 [Nocardia ninae NBRC 108245]
MTDSQDEPTALPEVRVGHVDREIAARQLQLAVEEGRLDLLELDRRLVTVYSARTTEELVAVTADLPAAATTREPIELSVGSGTRKKGGQWIVPAEITAECTSGTIIIDFSQAFCAHREVVLHASVGSGGLKLIVPRGWMVDVDRVRAKSGDVRSKVTGPVRPGAPLLRVDGRVGSGTLLARYPRRPRRSFLEWLRGKPRPA